MRADYENAIRKLREDHMAEAQRMQAVIDTQDKVISDLKTENIETRADASSRIDAAVRDNDIMNSNLQDAIRRSELADDEARKTACANDDMAKEIRILRQELNLLEQEHVKAMHKDKKQQAKLDKLNGIVYGKKPKK